MKNIENSANFRGEVSDDMLNVINANLCETYNKQNNESDDDRTLSEKTIV